MLDWKPYFDKVEQSRKARQKAVASVWSDIGIVCFYCALSSFVWWPFWVAVFLHILTLRVSLATLVITGKTLDIVCSNVPRKASAINVRKGLRGKSHRWP